MDDGEIEVRLRAGATWLFFFTVQTKSGAQSASCTVSGKGYFPGLNRPERECDWYFLCSSDVKNAWNYAFINPYVLIFWCLIKQMANFTSFHCC
jgi:hypothetical protein